MCSAGRAAWERNAVEVDRTAIGTGGEPATARAVAKGRPKIECPPFSSFLSCAGASAFNSSLNSECGSADVDPTLRSYIACMAKKTCEECIPNYGGAQDACLAESGWDMTIP